MACQTALGHPKKKSVKDREAEGVRKVGGEGKDGSPPTTCEDKGKDEWGDDKFCKWLSAPSPLPPDASR